MDELHFTQDEINDIIRSSTGEQEMASYVYERLVEEIGDFQDELDNEHEIGAMFANFGKVVSMVVLDIGYSNPNLIYFYGEIDGKESQLIQHMNQLNFVLTAVSRQTEKPPRRIGFDIPETED